MGPARSGARAASELPQPLRRAALTGQVVPLTKMRAIIAQRMVESVAISPHVYTVYKVDMTRDCAAAGAGKGRLRAEARRQADLHAVYCRGGGRGAAQISRSSTRRWRTASIHYHENIHLGIAVALEWGLIVPVVKQAEQRSFVELARPWPTWPTARAPRS